jgi:transposase
MARAYSQDLRDRVIDAALKGMSARQAAARFGIGDATAIVWVRRARQSGERRAHKQGQPRRSKLDPHREFLLAAIEATPDLTISELLERLLSERGVKAARATLWTFLDRCGLTFKKNRPCERTGPPGRKGAARSLVRKPARSRSGKARLHRRDLDHDQHGA